MLRYLTPEERKRLFKAAGQSNDIYARRDSAIIRGLYFSAERVGEFALMTVGDAEAALADKYHFIPKENRKGGKRDHSVYVTLGLSKALRDLLEIRMLITGEERPAKTAPLLVSRQSTDRPMTVRSIELRLKKWAIAAGLTDKFSPHWLRHTRAIDIMRRSKAADPRGVVKAALGHNSIASTGVYTGVLREDVENTLDDLDRHQGNRITRAELRRRFDRRHNDE